MVRTGSGGGRAWWVGRRNGGVGGEGGLLVLVWVAQVWG